MIEKTDPKKTSQIKFSAPAKLHEDLKIRAVREGREMQEILVGLVETYTGSPVHDRTEADRYCLKLRKFMEKRNLADAEKTGLDMIRFILDLWIK